MPDFNKAGYVAVFLFFFISAYGLELKRKTGGQLSSFYFFGRIYKILAPLLFPIIIYVGVCNTLDTGLDLGNLLISFSEWNIVIPYSWFVVKLLVVYIVLLLCRKIKKTTYHFVVFSSILLLFDAFCALCKSPVYTYLSDLGLIVGYLFAHIKKLPMQGTISCFSIICSLITISMTLYNTNGIIVFAQVFLLGISFPLVLCYITTSFVSSKWWKILIMISYDVYLCQGIAFEIAQAFNISVVTKVILVVLLTYMIAFLSNMLTKRILPKF